MNRNEVIAKINEVLEGSDNEMDFYHIKTFNPLMAMFVRNQLLEC